MAIESALSSSIRVRLNAGTRAGTGTMIVRTVQLGRMVAEAPADKVMSCVGALASILQHPLFRVERHEASILEN